MPMFCWWYTKVFQRKCFNKRLNYLLYLWWNQSHKEWRFAKVSLQIKLRHYIFAHVKGISFTLCSSPKKFELLQPTAWRKMCFCKNGRDQMCVSVRVLATFASFKKKHMIIYKAMAAPPRRSIFFWNNRCYTIICIPLYMQQAITYEYII